MPSTFATVAAFRNSGSQCSSRSTNSAYSSSGSRMDRRRGWDLKWRQLMIAPFVGGCFLRISQKVLAFFREIR